MSIPAIIYIVLASIGLLAASNMHGQQKTGEYNFWTSLLATSIIFGLLFWGGFFN